MGTALLLGIPAGYAKTAKSALAKNAELLNDWSIKFIPSPRTESEISPKLVEQTMEFASQHDDIHIFGLSGQKDRRRFEEQISPYFRFRWFEHALLKCLGSADPGPFVRELAMELAEESQWSARIKPANLNSPLLLPKSCFQTTGNHVELWRHANAYGDPQNINSAEKAIERFRNTYHRKVPLKAFSAYKWVDERDRIYDHDGERHGVAPFPRGCKSSYCTEPGFHYDVTHATGRKFVLIDALGQSHLIGAGSYLNVDAHGYVRT